MKNTILLADSDAAVRRMLSRLLAEENYFVVSAHNGEELLQAWSQSPVDLVLLDLNVPEKNGWEIFQRVAEKYPSVPIILTTDQSPHICPTRAGALMEKPLDLPKLLSVIRNLLDEPPEIRQARLKPRPGELPYLPPNPDSVAVS